MNFCEEASAISLWIGPLVWYLNDKLPAWQICTSLLCWELILGEGGEDKCFPLKEGEAFNG